MKTTSKSIKITVKFSPEIVAALDRELERRSLKDQRPVPRAELIRAAVVRLLNHAGA